LGTPLILAVGALVAVGALELWSTLAWAAAGAILGDGISFWLGYKYRERVRTIWPFNRYPHWLTQSEVYFHQHGGKSVVFGRFVGAARSIIPIVAGMLGMSPVRFYTISIISGLLWSPAYILLGAAMGASLSVAADVATRLLLFLTLLIGTLWLTAWLVKRLYLFLRPYANVVIKNILHWLDEHPRLSVITRGILDPRHPHIVAHIELAGLFILALVTLCTMLAWQFFEQAPLGPDGGVYYFFKRLQTPWADHAMIFINMMGSSTVSIAVTFAGLLWLAWRQHWHGMSHWLAVLSIGVFTALSLHFLLPSLPPNQYIEDQSGAFSYAQITTDTVVYGFLSILIASQMPSAWRRLPYTIAGLWIMLLMISYLYLGRHWFSDVLIGFTLGLAWVALLGIIYRIQHVPKIGAAGLSTVVMLSMILTGSWLFTNQHQDNMTRHAEHRRYFSIATADWQQGNWSGQELPLYRIDWEGYRSQPLTIQWVGNPEVLREHLLQNGWQNPQPLGVDSMLAWFSSEPSLLKLPVLPTVHDGRGEALKMVYYPPSEEVDSAPSHQLVLRLWPTDMRLDGKQPIWVGHVAQQFLPDDPLAMLHLPKTLPVFDMPLDIFKASVKELEFLEIPRDSGANDAAYEWSGKVLLLSPQL
ncbi:MAG: VTT domain-containing protein, partial [Pseudomonadota bacterium]